MSTKNVLESFITVRTVIKIPQLLFWVLSLSWCWNNINSYKCI